MNQNYYKGKIKELKLDWTMDGEGNKSYYMSMIYEYETEKGVYQLEMPKISLCRDTDALHVRTNPIGRTASVSIGSIHGANLKLDKVGGVLCDILYVERLIKEKVQEMTLDEIEKKLGYKVKIVNKEK